MLKYFCFKFYLRFVAVLLAMIFFPIVIFKLPIKSVIANGILWSSLITILIVHWEFKYYNLWVLFDNLNHTKFKLFSFPIIANVILYLMVKL